jgi:type I restriction enzyme R subunit
VDTETGQERLDHLEDERAFSAEDIERRITAPDSNRKIIEEIAKYARAHQERTGRFPKTLIFAVNDLAHTSHADNLVRLCREVFGEGDAFVQKITGNKNVDRPLRRIREFRNRPEPKIVVTVDMLSTGVDIPALEFIVFLRPVKSRILWEQMLGRGTRRCDDLTPPKSHFTVFDCFDGSLIEYFKGATGFEMFANRAKPVAMAEIIENIWQNVERDYNVRRLTRRLRRIERDMSGEARDLFVRFIPDGDMGRFAGDLPERLKRDFAGAMKLLRDPAFQDLLESYPRARRSFIVAEEFQDQVSSEYKFRIGDEHLKSGDYLERFMRFVAANRDEIEAIRILAERPRGWRVEALETLRQRLREADFPEEELQKVHGMLFQKSLADIISMIKHALDHAAPLLAAHERVTRAFERVRTGKQLTPEQILWLELIREHVTRNLALEISDFDLAPILEGKGGLARARRVFPDWLENLVAEINENLAAV